MLIGNTIFTHPVALLLLFLVCVCIRVRVRVSACCVLHGARATIRDKKKFETR